jgi:predicted DNA-binding transcriptional regulator YafY
VTDTAGRLLRLLPLLTARPNWRGDELAARLGVTTVPGRTAAATSSRTAWSSPAGTGTW